MSLLSQYENATELYNDAKKRWPTNKNQPSIRGRWILASYDDESIIVYQAYNEQIAKYASENHRFTGCSDYKPSRMTWIKTNFLWMMYRSQWGTSENQERILAIRLRRSAFDSYLADSSHTTKDLLNSDESMVKRRSHSRLIRLQWDPDHHPHGTPIDGRRAVQLGLKNVETFLDGTDIIQILDITPFVQTQYNNAVLPKDQLDQLRVPIENVYVPADEQIRHHIRLDEWTPEDEHATE